MAFDKNRDPPAHFQIERLWKIVFFRPEMVNVIVLDHQARMPVMSHNVNIPWLFLHRHRIWGPRRRTANTAEQDDHQHQAFSEDGNIRPILASRNAATLYSFPSKNERTIVYVSSGISSARKCPHGSDWPRTSVA